MLFIMRGTTLSGKDTFIKSSFPNPNHVLSSDNFREMMLGDITSQQHNKKVFDMIHEILECRFLNRVEWTVLNATHLRIKDCSVPIELCKKYRVPFTFISIVPPSIEELKERNEKRSQVSPLRIPESVIEKHHNRYEASKEPFLKEAQYSPLCTWIEIDQDWQVVHHDQ